MEKTQKSCFWVLNNFRNATCDGCQYFKLKFIQIQPQTTGHKHYEITEGYVVARLQIQFV